MPAFFGIPTYSGESKVPKRVYAVIEEKYAPFYENEGASARRWQASRGRNIEIVSSGMSIERASGLGFQLPRF